MLCMSRVVVHRLCQQSRGGKRDLGAFNNIVDWLDLGEEEDSLQLVPTNEQSLSEF